MKRIVLILVAFLLTGVVVSAQVPRPQITSFVTPSTMVDRNLLANRLARIPVSWTTANRPASSNLVFEQVMPDGRVINVELPRLDPYVASNGNGIVAPLPPGGGASTVVFQVWLVDTRNGSVYDTRMITLPIGDVPAPVVKITSFTAMLPSGSVIRASLANRTARVPVTWNVDNRPATANLYFEQILSNGAAVNVELPRLIPWVASQGVGVAAPVLPGDDKATSIRLTLTVKDLFNQKVYDTKEISVPIVDTPVTGRIDTFTADLTPVSRQAVANGIARINVSWGVGQRPDGSNLYFEQVLDNGSSVNIELPRQNPWVNSYGNGVVRPVLSSPTATTIKLRLRLADMTSNKTYDQRELTVPVIDVAPPTARINFFTTSAGAVEMNDLINRTARVPVAWLIDNRQNSQNLYFEQVLDNGTVVNIELPRQNPWVASSGNGVVAPVLPGSNANTIKLRLRLASMTDGQTVDTRELTLPIRNGQAGQFFEVIDPSQCFVNSFPAGNGLGANVKGIVVSSPYNYHVAPTGDTHKWIDGQLKVGDNFTVLEGPYCYRALYATTDGQRTWRNWHIRVDGSNLDGWASEYNQSITGQTTVLAPAQSGSVPQIVSFTASPAAAKVGDVITVSWEVANSKQVYITRTTNMPASDDFALNQPPKGSVTYTVTANDSGQIAFVLHTEHPRITATAVVTLTCPFSSSLTKDCPASQTKMQASFQTFENGYMFWKGDSKQIYVLFSGGSWVVYPDTWTVGEPIDLGGATPPQGRIAPANGFGKVWATQPGVRDRLGWAVAPESGYTATWQTNSASGKTTYHFTLPDNRVVHLEDTWRIE
jgi:hypothetical protein